MTKLLSAVVAATFAVVSLSPVAFAADKKAETLTDACKGKKAGEEVKVDGKAMKCPAPEMKEEVRASKPVRPKGRAVWPCLFFWRALEAIGHSNRRCQIATGAALKSYRSYAPFAQYR